MEGGRSDFTDTVGGRLGLDGALARYDNGKSGGHGCQFFRHEISFYVLGLGSLFAFISFSAQCSRRQYGNGLLGLVVLFMVVIGPSAEFQLARRVWICSGIGII